MASALPFPELPQELLRLMAKAPDAPHTVSLLWERGYDLPCANGLLAIADVLQSLRRLEDSRQVMETENRLTGQKAWKLTRQGKLNLGIS